MKALECDDGESTQPPPSAPPSLGAFDARFFTPAPDTRFYGTRPADSVVGIPNHGHGEAFFKNLHERTARLKGGREGVFEFQFIPDVSHRPFFVTRPVALWLERHL